MGSRRLSSPAAWGRRVTGAFASLWELVRDSGIRWSDDNCLRLGASLAYYAIFSIFPLLMLAVTAVGYVLGDAPETRARLVDQMASVTTPVLRELFDDTLRNMQEHRTARGISALVGVVTLVAGASGVFSELEATLNQIWRVPLATGRSFWHAVLSSARGKALSFLVVLGAAVALLASLIVSATLTAIGQTVEGVAPSAVAHLTLWILVEVVGSIGVLTIVVAMIFRLIPQARVEWRDVLGGALLTALLWTAIKRLLAWYLGHLGSYAAYGAVGGFLALLFWVYLASQFLFFGAEFSRVYAERFGSLAKKD